jgi:hypothetical protein
MMTGVRPKVIADNKVTVEDMTWITVIMGMARTYTALPINTEEI